jgi:hypothetical protein
LPSWAQRSYGNGGRGGAGGKDGGDEKGSDSKNGNSPTATGGKNIAKNAITGAIENSGNNDKDKGSGDNKNDSNNSNLNNQKVNDGEGKGNALVNNAIQDTGKQKSGLDDLYDE